MVSTNVCTIPDWKVQRGWLVVVITHIFNVYNDRYACSQTEDFNGVFEYHPDFRVIICKSRYAAILPPTKTHSQDHDTSMAPRVRLTIGDYAQHMDGLFIGGSLSRGGSIGQPRVAGIREWIAMYMYDCGKTACLGSVSIYFSDRSDSPIVLSDGTFIGVMHLSLRLLLVFPCSGSLQRAESMNSSHPNRNPGLITATRPTSNLDRLLYSITLRTEHFSSLVSPLHL